jgi:hypothetical protein
MAKWRLEEEDDDGMREAYSIPAWLSQNSTLVNMYSFLSLFTLKKYS